MHCLYTHRNESSSFNSLVNARQGAAVSTRVRHFERDPSTPGIEPFSQAQAAACTETRRSAKTDDASKSPVSKPDELYLLILFTHDD